MLQTPGITEIDEGEFQVGKVVGRGAFGVVRQASWNGSQVAVKFIQATTDNNAVNAIKAELRQMARAQHKNIIKLFATSTPQSPNLFLVMEYAQGGSLYNVLHGSGPQPHYTLDHAISWLLQCAEGVAYLHNMKPKPIVHRDLKPPNLLLDATGTMLKICDFGTATEKHSMMTNNRGSAAWMAPEVFEGFKYNEKCDVFSWGIMVWEVITRRKPFDELGGQAFSIMWKVHTGTRPPLVAGMPEPLEILMTRCWAPKPADRPSFDDVLVVVREMSKHLGGSKERLQFYQSVDSNAGLETASMFGTERTSTSATGLTISYTADGDTMIVPQSTPLQPLPQNLPQRQIVVEEDYNRQHPSHHQQYQQQISAPPSLAASRENLSSPPGATGGGVGGMGAGQHFDAMWSRRPHRHSADIDNIDPSLYMPQHSPGSPHLQLGGANAGASAPQSQHQKNMARGHRRSGSYGSYLVVPENNTLNFASSSQTMPSARGHQRKGSYGHDGALGGHMPPHTGPPPLHHSETAPGNLNAPSMKRHASQEILDILPLDSKYTPIPPDASSEESVAIYNEHMQMVEEYRQIQANIALLSQKESDYENELKRNRQEQEAQKQRVEKYNKLMNENDSLLKWQRDLQIQVEQIRKSQGRMGATNV